MPNNFGINQNKVCMKKVNPEQESRKLGTFMNFLTDFAFKKILGNARLLIDFLNEMVGEECKVASLDYLQLEQLGRTDKDRKAVYDIYCKNERDVHFIIEMQVAYQKHYLERILFYATFPIQKHAIKGKWNYGLKSVYCISIVNFEIFDKGNYLSRLNIYNSETMEKVTDKLNFITIELPKFNKTLRQLETRLDKWIYCIKHLGNLTKQPAEFRDEIFDELFETASINTLKEENMRQYDKSITEYEDVQVCMADTMELGMITRNIEIAKKSLQMGLSIDLISELTGLTPKQIIQMQ